MTERLGYVVITFNQAGGRPDLHSLDLHYDLESAMAERDHEADETDKSGRRDSYVVAEVIERGGE